MSKNLKFSRREALSTAGKVAISAIIAGVIAGLGGYYAGTTISPRTITETKTKTVTAGATTVKETVTVTAPGVTTTVTAPVSTVTEKATITETITSTLTAELKKHFEGIKIRFFCGGDPGDAFASIVYKGALEARDDLGPDVEYVFSGWDAEKMVAQFRDAVAAAPDGICMMGHPGEDALGPLIDEAFSKGIIVTLQNVDLPNIRKKYASKGMGYVGQVLYDAGVKLAEGAISRFNLKPGDRVVVIGPWQQPGRLFREKGVADTFEKYGLIVDKILAKPEWATDPAAFIPELSGYVSAHPDVKLICYPGGQMLAAAPQYMEAVGKEPGEIINIGFDLNPAVIEGFKAGYVQLTLDQQPYLQGYLPILQVCISKVYKFAGLYIDTGGALVDATNYKELEELVKQGYR